jgi:hypothetical protein
MIAAMIALLWMPENLVNMFSALALGSMFAWSGAQIYYARKAKESYKRWGGFDGGGGRENRFPPGGGQSPEIYSN